MALNVVSSDRLSTNVKTSNLATGLSDKVGQNKNLIINGAMKVAQRGTSETTTTGMYTVDRFTVGAGGQDESPDQAQHALTSSDTGPWAKGFRYSWLITNGNQTGGAGAADYMDVQHRIEAQNINQSGWDYTSASSYITLSFWIKSSVAQNFYGYLRSRDGTNQRYGFETGSLSADTWTKITKTIPGNSNIQFDNDNGEGLRIAFLAFLGGDYTASGTNLNTWEAYSSSTITPDQTSTWWTTNNATLEFTGFQLEVGDTATEFEHRSYENELIRCLRYYYRTGEGQSLASNSPLAQGWARTATLAQLTVTFPVPMRAAPAAIETTGTATDYDVSNVASGFSCSAVPTFDGASTTQAHVYFTVASGLTVAGGARGVTDGAGKYIAFSSEL